VIRRRPISRSKIEIIHGDARLTALIDASALLDEMRGTLISEPWPIYSKVLHARDHIDWQIDELKKPQ
jgi:hypothetical protein